MFDTEDDEKHTTVGLPPKGARTLAKLAEAALLEQLRSAVSMESPTASYCCGGTIQISTSDKAFRSSTSIAKPAEAPQLVLRWDPPGEDCSRKIKLPPSIETDENDFPQGATCRSLDELIRAFSPSSLKRNHEGTPRYHQGSVKLNTGQFCINFHPHDYGILDAIAQVLLPRYIIDELEDRQNHQGTVCEN